MCGIVGIAGSNGGDRIRQMNNLLLHRGPDDQGVYQDVEAQVSLAMRRLSIIDLDSGSQPMSNEDGSIWIVFNGEIYNAPALRLALEARGHHFATHNSDTETLLHLYEEKGAAALQELNGMFAFVIYDQRRQRLFGARDRMGIKPLYYWHGGRVFAFASELKALLLLPEVERRIDLQSLYHYLTLLYVPGEASIIEGVRRLPPAHYFTYDVRSGRFEQQSYWRLRFAPQQRTEAEWAEVLRGQLRQAVQRWTLSDVPIACSLSGGVDSSALVGLLAETGYSPIHTYTLGFHGEGEQDWNETERARLVAERWGAQHHEFYLRPADLLRDLIKMVWQLDEPYAGGLPSWYVYQQMSQQVKVGLTGAGGDELFGNYGKFVDYEARTIARWALALQGRWPKLSNLLSAVSQPLAALADRMPSEWGWVGRGHALSRLPETLRSPFGAYYYAQSAYLSDATKRSRVLQEEALAVENTSVYLQSVYAESRTEQLRDGLAAVDFRLQLAEEFLLMTDRFSMAHSLEARTPFLDHDLVETVFQIPASARTRAGDLKYLFKQAIGDLLPPGLAAMPKRGFVLPVEKWLRGELRPLVQQLLSPERLQSQGLFRPEFYQEWVLPHLAGQKKYTWQVWAALMFQLWRLVYIEQRCCAAPPFTLNDLVSG